MSKKKSTMTLKDFHGGIIPSELPLPSAPGMTMRSLDRSSCDRQATWGRADYHRARPHTSPSMRTFDDRTPFITYSSRIGRHFDEDERKPLNGVSVPCRVASDDALPPLPVWAEMNLDSVTNGRLSGQTGLVPVSPLPSSGASSYSSRVAENVGVNTRPSTGDSSESHLNAWAARKAVFGVTEPRQSVWSESVISAKLAHASALEKVSSGRWLTKLLVHQQLAVEVCKYSEMESGSNLQGRNDFTDNKTGAVKGKDSYDATLPRHAARSLNVEERLRKGEEMLLVHERTKSPVHLESKENNPTSHKIEAQQSYTNGKSGRPSQPVVIISLEPSERPRLKLLPRSKPVENSEPPVLDYKKSYQVQTDSVHAKYVTESDRNVIPSQLGSDGSERRPKLNLKPRSQPIQRLQGNVETERDRLFGGARPRELVLKERGASDVADNYDLIQSPTRFKHAALKTETAPVRFPVHQRELSVNLPFDHKIGKHINRKDQRMDANRGIKHMRNWRSDNQRINRETEKKQLARQRSPETWRKPEPNFPVAHGMQCGKVASAVELAQAFSKSMSDPERFSSHRSLPPYTQMPFSRLMAPIPRPQINIY